VNSRSLTYGVATALVVLVFAGSGLANLVGAEHVVHDMAKLGYPRYFCIVLGTWKMLGAFAVAVPRLPRVKEWAYAGMIFDLTGAAASRAASGDGAAAVVIPLGIALIVATSWWLRPLDRVLLASGA
jgi:uncharacterized membrane protein YphA (DoxX/SURF4 family)